MKKTNLLVLSAAAALLATSCSKDQVTQSNPGDGIRFNVLTGAATKATEVNSSNPFSAFTVHARYGVSTSLNFNETYTNTSDNGTPVWSPSSSESHYWPSSADEQVKFFAYSPTTLSTDFAEQPSTAPLTINVPNDTTTAFSVANITPNLHASLQKDLVIAQMQTAKPSNSNAATLKFHHVFSQIELQASCGDPNMVVTVYGAKVHGFTVPKSSLTWKDTRVTQVSNVWNGTPTTAMSYMVGGTDVTSPVVLGTDPTTIMGNNGNADGNFMIIPQNISNAWNYTEADKTGGYIAVLCKIEKNTGTPDAPVYTQIFPTNTAYKYGFTAVPFSQQFQIGKKYTYKLQFFTNGGGGGVTPPDPIDPTDPDNPEIDPTPITPVLAPMTFTVSVNDWTNGTTNPGDGNLPLQ